MDAILIITSIFSEVQGYILITYMPWTLFHYKLFQKWYRFFFFFWVGVLISFLYYFEGAFWVLSFMLLLLIFNLWIAIISQFCIWDHFKELESMPLIRSMHLAKFVAEMVASFTLSLAVLKTIELGNMKQLTPKRIMHFRMLFEALFEYPDKLIWNIFTRVAITPELESLRHGIEFFIKQYVLKSNKAITEKFKVVKKALNNAEGVLLWVHSQYTKFC